MEGAVKIYLAFSYMIYTPIRALKESDLSALVLHEKVLKSIPLNTERLNKNSWYPVKENDDILLLFYLRSLCTSFAADFSKSYDYIENIFKKLQRR